MMKMRKRYIWIAVLLVYFISVAYLCFMKTDGLPMMRPYLFGIPTDKLVHFAMFFPYPVFGYAAFQPYGKKRSAHLIVLLAVFAVGAGLAIATEHLQGRLEYRSYDMKDYLADMLGMASATIMIAVYALTRRMETTNE